MTSPEGTMKRRTLAGASHLTLSRMLHGLFACEDRQKAAYVTLSLFNSIKMIETIMPNELEICTHLLNTSIHSYRVEYLSTRLLVDDHDDPDRPHDIFGPGNKFTWDCIKGLSLAYRDRKKYGRQIIKAVHFHRQQYHHQQWNKDCSQATDSARKLGAIDTVCSRLESAREYQQTVKTVSELRELEFYGSNNQLEMISWVISELERIKMPDLSGVVKFSDIPKTGVPAQTHDTIMERVYQTFQELRTDQGYKFANL